MIIAAGIYLIKAIFPCCPSIGLQAISTRIKAFLSSAPHGTIHEAFLFRQSSLLLFGKHKICNENHYTTEPQD
jgi:hypothetical protein